MWHPPRPPGSREHLGSSRAIQAGLSLSFPMLYNKEAGQTISEALVGFQPFPNHPPILSPILPWIPGSPGVWQYVGGRVFGWATKVEIIYILEEMTWGYI